MRHHLLIAMALSLSATGLAGQGHEGHGSSPYVELQSRDIKALSAADVDALLGGEGMGFALAAELNGYPGPRHVLELADSLDLTSEQRERVEALMGRMQERARALGSRVVEAERALDRSFAGGAIDPAGLEESVATIARLRGELRAVHLGAHIAMIGILTPHQRHLYQTLRGYAATHHGSEAPGSGPARHD